MSKIHRLVFHRNDIHSISIDFSTIQLISICTYVNVFIENELNIGLSVIKEDILFMRLTKR